MCRAAARWQLAAAAAAHGAGPLDRGRSLRGRHHRRVRPRHFLHRRYGLRPDPQVHLLGHPDVCARTVRPSCGRRTPSSASSSSRASSRSRRKVPSRSSANRTSGMEEVIVGVVGRLQFEVLEYRLKNEYNVEIIRENCPTSIVRWIENDEEDFDPKHLQLTSDTKLVEDLKRQQPAAVHLAVEHHLRDRPQQGAAPRRVLGKRIKAKKRPSFDGLFVIFRTVCAGSPSSRI